MKFVCKGEKWFRHELRSEPVDVNVEAEDRDDAKFLLSHGCMNTDEYTVHIDLRTVRHAPNIAVSGGGEADVH